ncbi:MAG: energy-converting hydrogenase Eha subunit F, partial [Candidatus Pelagisphaera sp.]
MVDPQFIRFPRYSKRILFVLLLSLSSLFGQTVYEQLELVSPAPTPNNIVNLQYENGKFLAPTDRGGILLSSDDGVSWVTHDTTYANSLNDVAYGNGLY